jgi:hypothetical protein
MMLRNPEAMKKAHERWREMAEERDQWTAGVIEELIGAPATDSGNLAASFRGLLVLHEITYGWTCESKTCRFKPHYPQIGG